MPKKATKKQIKQESDVKQIIIKEEVLERETTKDESVPEKPIVKAQKTETKTSLGKRSRKSLKKQFLELEADEGDEEDDSDVKKQPTAAEVKQQYYKDDELMPSATRLDNAFIKKLEIRAKKKRMMSNSKSNKI